MSWSLPMVDSCEGELLRRSVLIRNAIKAAASVTSLYSSTNTNSNIVSTDSNASTSALPQPTDKDNNTQSSSSSTYSKEKISPKERWVLMVNRSGLHPSDRIILDDNYYEGDEEERLWEDNINTQSPQYQQVQVCDYYCSDEEEEGEREDGKEECEEAMWFQGLLQEVSSIGEGEEGGSGSSMSASIADDGDAQAIVSSTRSLPSLIEDDDDDDEQSSEEEGEELQDQLHISPTHPDKNHSSSLVSPLLCESIAEF